VDEAGLGRDDGVATPPAPFTEHFAYNNLSSFSLSYSLSTLTPSSCTRSILKLFLHLLVFPLESCDDNGNDLRRKESRVEGAERRERRVNGDSMIYTIDMEAAVKMHE
jgi:hypothetical protein